ncbi:glycoside hydrolase family 38 C-terminal domain-containing protein [Paenibacillus sp.]|uniref:glycoside hydrolase family 38 N-terminal domain-containing protein n=1 Tax=Paenibacillus sp. TaxID=58172 RepID=UPI002D4E3B03|nr:glycoside hydrolase family 38 C-terminal domain-containing protein [Paenibacillus sp.]HZG55993.1 glycoside hydrolase family 38 C-terminal domain-containing protein [Paenibacillus sp.]
MLKRLTKAVAALSAAATFWVGSVGTAMAYDKSYEAFAIGNAHIDTAWKWTITTTIEPNSNPATPYLYTTWNNQLNLIDSNPGYKFNGSSAQHFAWIKEYWPQMFADIQSKVADGSWIPAGGAWVEHETMMASGESLARSYLLGQKFFRDNFNKTVDHAFLPDSFGFSWIMPQILKNSGMDSIMVTRMTTHNDDLSRWRGVDGTEITMFRPLWMYPNGGNFNNGVNTTNKEGLKSRYNSVITFPAGLGTGIAKGMYLLGAGDSGGGPNQDQITMTNDLSQNDPDTPVVTYRSVSDYYNALSQSQRDNLPLHDKELLLKSTHGTFTSQSAVKKYNRKSEVLLEEAEKLSTAAMWLGGADYPSDTLDFAWKKKLVNDFHDILPGTNTRDATEEAWNNYEIALNLTQGIVDNALAVIADRADTSGAGAPIVVYNPLSFARSDVVDVTVTFPSVSDNYVRVYDPNGNEIPSQAVKKGNGFQVVFIANDVPSLGHAVYRVVPSSTQPTYNTGLSSGGNTMNNNKYTVEINPATGNIKRIYDKQHAKEVLYPNSEVELQRLDEWDQSWDVTYAQISGTPTKMNAAVTPELIESGPVRNVYRITKSIDKSTYTQDIVLYSTLDRIDMPTTVDWHEQMKMLKVAFHLSDAAKDPYTTYDLSYGAVQRGVNSIPEWHWNDQDDRHEPSTYEPIKYEVPGHKWADVSNASQNFGVSILNDSKYGWDKPNDNTIRLSLLRSARDLDVVQDEGLHTFTYSLYSHSGDWKSANTPQQAYSLNAPLLAMQTSPHSGTLGKSYSFVSVNQPNVLITAVKKKENSNDVIIRLAETQGAASTNVDVTFNGSLSVSNVAETNFLEDDKSPNTIAHSGNTVSTTLGKYQVKTFRASVSSALFVNTNPVSTPIDLASNNAFNHDGLSTDVSMNDGAMDGSNSYNGSLIPASFKVDSVAFERGSIANGSNNVILANGQAVTLGVGGTYDYLYFLASTAGGGGSQHGTFTVNYSGGGSASKYFHVPDWTERIGGFGVETVPDRIALVLSHSHQQDTGNGHDNINKTNFIYMYRIPLDSGKTPQSVTLPNTGNRMKILAMTAVKNSANSNTVVDDQAPSQVTGLSASVANGNTYNGDVTLSWNASTDDIGVKRYVVYRDTQPNFAPNYRNKVGETTAASFVDSVVGHATYYYKVAAEDNDNAGAFSNEVSVTAGPSLNLPFNVDGFSYYTASTDGSGFDSYAIYMADGLHPSKAVVRYGDTKYKLSSLNNGQNNLFRPDSATDLTLDAATPLTSVKLMAAATGGDQSLTVTVKYSDQTSTQQSYTIRDWCATPLGTIVLDRRYRYHVSGGGKDNFAESNGGSGGCKFYQYELSPDSGKAATAINISGNSNVRIAAVAVKATGSQSGGGNPGSEDVQVSLSGVVNQDGFSSDGNRYDGDFDLEDAPSKTTYPTEGLADPLTYNGTTYDFINLADGAGNNAVAGSSSTGVNIAFSSQEQGVYSAIKFLGAATYGTQSAVQFLINYSDSTFSTQSVTVRDWCTTPASTDVVVKSYDHRHHEGADQAMSATGCHIYEYTLHPTPGKTVTGVTLPSNGSVHVIAMTLKKQVQVDLRAHFDEDAFSSEAVKNDGDLDGYGSTYPYEIMTSLTPTYDSGVKYSYGPMADGSNNSVRVNGELLQLEAPNKYSEVYILGAGTNGSQSGTLTFHYSDSTTGTATLSFNDWCTNPSGDEVESFAHRHFGNADQQMSTGCYIYEKSFPVDANKTLTGITLPAMSNNNLHVYAVTLVP